MKDFFGGLVAEIRGAFGNVRGNVQLGDGQSPKASLSFGKSHDRFWIFVIVALVVGVLLGRRA